MSETSTISITAAGRAGPQADGLVCQLRDNPRKVTLIDSRAADARTRGRQLTPGR